MNPALAVYLGLAFVSLLCSAHDHGKPNTGKKNFWWSLGGTLIQLAILLWALHWRIS